MATKCLFKILDKIYLFLDRSQKNWKLEGFHLDCDQVSFQNTQSNLFVSTQVTKEKNIERPSPVWRPSAFSKYSTKFICFHPGHKRKENWKSFTWMATKILHQNYLFPQRSQKTETWKAFTWMATKFLFKILHQIYLFISTQVTKDLKFWRLSQNIFVSRQVTKELKIGRLSLAWRPSPFSKYSTKFICFHTGHKGKEN